MNPESWIDRYSDMLYRYALKSVYNADDAKDLIQETFLAALRNIEDFRGEISEKNWLFMILKNKIIDFYRKKTRDIITSIGNFTDSIDEYFDEDGNWNPNSKPSIWHVDYNTDVEKEEFFKILYECLEKLSELQKITFTLKYFEDLSSEEICKEIGISASNYWVLVHRAKLQLRRCLEANWFK